MKFWEAMKIVDEGGKVQRGGYWNQDWIIRKGKSHPIIIIENLETHATISVLDTLDMSTNDWVEVKDEIRG